jgi:SET domain-containing protein
MKSLFKNKNLYIGESSIHGWGVFCSSHIKEGDLIEECNCIDVTNTSEFSIDRYVFHHEGLKLIPLGFCSSLNSYNIKNVDYSIDEKKIISFYSTKDIKPGEELFMFYYT